MDIKSYFDISFSIQQVQTVVGEALISLSSFKIVMCCKGFSWDPVGDVVYNALVQTVAANGGFLNENGQSAFIS